jgi:DNA-binding transcriptional MerR regulator
MRAKRKPIKDANDSPALVSGFLIGDLAKRFGITSRTLRFYEQRGLLSSHRAAGHMRLFGQEQVTRLRAILRAKEMGFTLEEIRGFLSAHERDQTSSADFKPDDDILQSQLSNLEKRRGEIDAAIMELKGAMRQKSNEAPEPGSAPERRRG